MLDGQQWIRSTSLRFWQSHFYFSLFIQLIPLMPGILSGVFCKHSKKAQTHIKMLQSSHDLLSVLLTPWNSLVIGTGLHPSSTNYYVTIVNVFVLFLCITVRFPCSNIKFSLWLLYCIYRNVHQNALKSLSDGDLCCTLLIWKWYIYINM